jgi:ATP/maltotriose-dependent transcriptional regulator MalT/DNA-binding SARP family transcriptional activator
LLRALLGRWDHRVMTVVGGPGLGKTTLLAQAVAENRLAPRGEDVWLGLAPDDADGDSLARDMLAAVTAGAPEGAGSMAANADARRVRMAVPNPRDEAPDPAAIADAVWRRAPTAVCLVVDDGHCLTAGSAGAAWLAGLVDALPSNGHVLVSGRWAPPVPLARLATQGAVLRLTEDDLRFSEGELASFAAQRGVPADRLTPTGGWPAMAELAASLDGVDGAGTDLAGDYLWEEVLEPLGPDRRRVLAVLSDLGGADDALAAAALGERVDLAALLDGVPLVAQGGGGWRVPHPLWRTVPALALSDADRRDTRRRAIRHLVATERYDEAVVLAVDADLADEVPGILRSACIGPMRPPARRLERWLTELPPEAAGTPGAALAVGLRTALATPGEATEALDAAIQVCRESGDIEGELSAIALLGRVAWWRNDLGTLAELFPRVLQLEAEGHPLARAIAGLGRAVLADLRGTDEEVLYHLDAIEEGMLDPAWETTASWLRAATLAGRGDVEEAAAILDAMPTGPDPAFELTVEGARLLVRWAQGEVDAVLAAIVPLLENIKVAGVLQNVMVAQAQTAVVYASLGEVDLARRYLADARETEAKVGGVPSTRVETAEVALLVAEGDEAAASAKLVEAMAQHRIDGVDRRVWRSALALTYVLVPTCRPAWDAAPLRGSLAYAHRLAQAVVALRERSAPLAGPESPQTPGASGTPATGTRPEAGEPAAATGASPSSPSAATGSAAGVTARATVAPSGAVTRNGGGMTTARQVLAGLDLSDPNAVRAALHYRYVVELALAAEESGRPEAGPLLESLGPPGREAVRAAAAAHGRRSRPARSLLAAVPVPPRQTTEIAVLGPIEIVRDAEPIVDPDLRRERVRALLAFLVGQRTTTRAAIMAALWPDLDERAAANNLRVTMTYLLRLLEPWRSARESSYFVRLDGASVALVTGDRLRVDVDAFDDHLAKAARAEADGVPSEALDHNLAAERLYRGDLFDGVADAEWISLDRERVRARFVTAATRAGQLLVGRGDADEAERVARRAIAADPWAEAAYGVLVSVALARGDRSAARLALDRCLAALTDIGVEPSEDTRRLRRRVRNA